MTDLRTRALDVLLQQNLTADEVAERLGASPLAVRPRISELHKRGLIEDTGELRLNLVSGRAASVWCVTSLAIQLHSSREFKRWDTRPVWDGALVRLVRKILGRRPNGARA